MKIPKKSNETVDEPGRAHAGDENFVAKGMLAEPAHNIKEREKYIPTAKQRKPINYLTPDVSVSPKRRAALFTHVRPVKTLFSVTAFSVTV